MVMVPFCSNIIKKGFLLFFVFNFCNLNEIRAENFKIFKWKKPDYSYSLKPDLETIKRLGSLFYAMKKVNPFYSKESFLDDLSKLKYSEKDLKYLKNDNTIKYIKNYVNYLNTLEDGIPSYEVFFE